MPFSACKALSTLATIVAEFGDCRRKRRQSPNLSLVRHYHGWYQPSSTIANCCWRLMLTLQCPSTWPPPLQT